MVAIAPRLLRVLCLHGYAQNGETLRSRTGALRKGLKSSCEFVFIDAPHPATASFVEAGEDGGEAKLAWWNAASDEADGTRPSQSMRYAGWDESQTKLEELFAEQGHFDGILAFSQGAAAAAVLLAALSAQERPVAFAILVSGFIPRDESVSRLLRAGPKLAVATLHCCGEADTLVPASVTGELASLFEAPVVFKHTGGHVVPGNAPFRAAIKLFVEPHYAAANVATEAGGNTAVAEAGAEGRGAEAACSARD
ncbi:serine hydrolase FSH [Pavlovales sp. CCMP2436]|nr:serine hydrolase FSH [Pavlovales sp. CCMP2436]|mmetsp:Transcript_17891/g.45794  ORF Transcript_17891/g.45794 Transcript_17891/m.45794 type:complete len:253 (-) Transcript_17891:113-871(-)